MQIKTGVEGKDIAFLFTDTQIVVETMLEDLNNVLNSGEIPNLFPQDEQVCFWLNLFPTRVHTRHEKSKHTPQKNGLLYIKLSNFFLLLPRFG